MDSLDFAALEERIERLLKAGKRHIHDEFDEYGEALDILWEEEFRASSLRILEVAAKMPYGTIRGAFLRRVVRTVILPLSFNEVVAILQSVIDDSSAHARMRNLQMTAIPLGAHAGERPRPGVG